MDNFILIINLIPICDEWKEYSWFHAFGSTGDKRKCVLYSKSGTYHSTIATCLKKVQKDGKMISIMGK